MIISVKAIFNVLLNIFRVTVLIHVVTSICVIVGVSLSNDGLLLPWLIFTWIQFLQYFVMFVFAMVIEQYFVGGLCVLYFICLGIFYICIWRYFKQLRLENGKGPAVTANQKAEHEGGKMKEVVTDSKFKNIEK